MLKVKPTLSLSIMAWGKRGRGSSSGAKKFQRRGSSARASAVTRVLRKAPSAQNQKSQILSLSKRVTALNKVVAPMQATVTWRSDAAAGMSIPIGSPVDGGSIPYTIGLPYSLQRQFTDRVATIDAGTGVQRAKVVKWEIFVDVSAIADTERDWITLVCFSLKKVAKTRWSKGYIDVLNDTMTPGEDFAHMGEQVKMNPDLYKVHAQRNFQMGVWDTFADGAGNSASRFYESSGAKDLCRKFKFNISHPIEYVNTNADDWHALQIDEIPIGHHVYVQAFAGRSGSASTSGLQKHLSVSALVTTVSADK